MSLTHRPVRVLFEAWLISSVASDIPELKRFVAGIERDYEAVLR